jgi:asparagine synthase (glutamine-hydrolysing)
MSFILNTNDSIYSKVIESLCKQTKQVDIRVNWVVPMGGVAATTTPEIIPLDDSLRLIEINNIQLYGNGIIYNSHELFQLMGFPPKTEEPFEVILWLYDRYGLDEMLHMIDGDFSFVLIDQRAVHTGNSTIVVATDVYGMRPLYMIEPVPEMKRQRGVKPVYGFSNNKHFLDQVCDSIQPDEPYRTIDTMYRVVKLKPGTFSTMKLPNAICSFWEIGKREQPYYMLGGYSKHSLPADHLYHITEAVEKRCRGVPIQEIACMLTGERESMNIVRYMTNYYYKETGVKPVYINTYSLTIMDDDGDSTYNTHTNYFTELRITRRYIKKVIKELIELLETRDPTELYSHLQPYLMSQAIKKHNPNIKYIFTNVGSNEIMGKHVITQDVLEYDTMCKTAIRELHETALTHSYEMYLQHGVYLMAPFTDKNYIQHYLSICPHERWQMRIFHVFPKTLDLYKIFTELFVEIQ